MEMEGLLNYEVNMLTEENVMSREAMIKAIRAEFDFIKMCQAMIKPFGYEAREVLDRFIALSLRKLLCDKDSMLRKVSRDFKMPPLVGGVYNCPGENQEMKLVQINPDVHVKCQKDWMPLDMWLREKISWIEKDENDIPLAYGDRFYCSLAKKLEDTCFKDLFSKDIIDDSIKS